MQDGMQKDKLSKLIRPSEASWDDLDNWCCHAELSGSQGLSMVEHIKQGCLMGQLNNINLNVFVGVPA